MHSSSPSTLTIESMSASSERRNISSAVSNDVIIANIAHDTDCGMVEIDHEETFRKYHPHPTRRRRCFAQYGNTRVLYSCTRKYGLFPLTAHIGPDWLCMLFTYSLAIGPIFIVMFNHKFNYALRLALVISSAITTVSFSMVACSDPGIVYESCQDLAISQEVTTTGEGLDSIECVLCAQCQLRRPKDASHCSDCGVCVLQLDHHCPWTGKCIGSRTLYWFYIFLWAITGHVMLFAVATTISFLSR